MRGVSRETSERLAAYQALVKKWNPRINLIARSTLDQIYDRHIRDSAQLVDMVGLNSGAWADIGSGGGFPGLVAAILRANQPISFSLIESDQRKATFLRACARELALPNVQVHAARIEALKPAAADIVSARALAPLPDLMSYVHRHMKPDGAAWLLKGESWQSEVQDAKVDWRFDFDAHPSQTHDGAAILRITNLSHV
ncbi:16S rRNA (guanine(527)-N(7))-methyltransferase RsmG [Paracoccus tegillarcae]|uniref:Ribosomal RNA small subunit methyltransferase G n=1 Tax=Paracoccus tegillarcae TaxID=1529068 RepID=A0A2K9EYR1_9RHOB|nr:16S rRNA (guanine(527)-N(7))-methyltransferase RsmG [Paracoccus tegillarcae]AUH33242.1 16S rRNA (guanine(527)-N(7))-methyltransferase RsmG [Paracoccus tegillarcae]